MAKRRKRRKSQKKNGWFTTVRVDSRTGKKRPIRIKYVNGREVERHWLDVKKIQTNAAATTVIDPFMIPDDVDSKDAQFLKKEFFVKDNYDLVDKSIRRYWEKDIIKMDNDEREKKHKEIKHYQELLQKRLEITQSDNEKRRLKNEINQVDGIERRFERFHAKYEPYCKKLQNYPKSRAITIDEDVQDALYELQEDSREWGGGVNFEMKNDNNPAKLIVRQGNEHKCKSDIQSDVSIHTHPTTENKINDSYNYDLQRAEQNIDLLKNDVKTEASKKKIENLKSELTDPWNYLPSGQDINNVQQGNPNRSHVVISENGAFVMTKPGWNTEKVDIKEKMDKNVKETTSLAAVKTDLTYTKPSSIKDAERKIEQYHKEVINANRSILQDNKIQSEFYPKDEPIQVITQDYQTRKSKRKNERKYYVKDEKK